MRPVPLTTRHMLPWYVALAWLWGTVQFAFPGSRSLQDFLYAARTGALPGRWTDWEQINWLLMMLAAMVVVDRLYVAWVRRRAGVDPLKLHWSELRNREGKFICAHCLSPFLLPPPDFDEDEPVRCGDCGAAKARYGDMKPHLDPAGALREMASRLRR